jgi:hypothetical protein
MLAETPPIPQYGFSRGDVVIGNDVWVCSNSIVLSGVSIGDGAVIAAGAVVTRDVEPYSIVAGNPAKHIKWRFDEFTRKQLLQIAWWDWPISEISEKSPLLCSERFEELLAYAANRKTPQSIDGEI